jgi:maleamate amidohydrolase
LVVVDVNYGFCGDRAEPILESIKRWRNSCGADAWVGITVIKQLIDAAHDKGIPVFYTTGVWRADNWDQASWAWKNSRTDEREQTRSNLDPDQIIDVISPGPRDIVIQKQKPSAFFGTPFQSYLTLLGCDSVILTGTTTSGCVRATAIDAFSNNYRVAVVEDGCFDRS